MFVFGLSAEARDAYTKIQERRVSFVKTKRLVALVLALVMMFCFMAVSASAATTEVQPRGNCPGCTIGYVYIQEENLDSYMYDNSYDMVSCSKMSALHAHYHMPKRATVTCSNCGYRDQYTYTGRACPYGGV